MAIQSRRLRWTCKSVRKLAEELNRQGHQVSHRLVAELLQELGYSLQANRKTREGHLASGPQCPIRAHPCAGRGLPGDGQPVISVDTKKKELVGDFKNGGRELRPQGEPEQVRVHDFVIPELGKVMPYGVYDVTHNLGWVSVGIDHDTATFAVESIRRWWRLMGQPLYPAPRQLLITADGGGSNGSRLRLWKVELQKLADETGLAIAVCHLPPGTSKWNKIEHRLFSLHQPELAWQTADQPRSDRQPDRRHHDPHWAQSPLSIGHTVLCEGHRDLRRRTGASQLAPRRFPWRVELRDLTPNRTD